MRTLKAHSSLDGWRSMVLEMNNQRRDLQIDFPNEDHCRKFTGMVERMRKPVRINTNRHNAKVIFNSITNN